jgi:hypothetical protein
MAQNRWTFDVSTANGANADKIGALAPTLANVSGATLTPVSSPMTPVGAGYYGLPNADSAALTFANLNTSPGVFYMDMYVHRSGSASRWVALLEEHVVYGYMAGITTRSPALPSR